MTYYILKDAFDTRRVTMRRALAHLKKSDPVMAAIIDRIGPYAPRFRDPGFEVLVRAIVSQQLSEKAAATIMRRLEQRVAPKGGLTPQAILSLRASSFRAVGLSRQKQNFVRDLAARVAAGEIDFRAMEAMDDDGVIETLTRVKGIGPWTAQMFLIFALKRTNVLPLADIGLLNAAHRAYQLPARPDAKMFQELGARWHPWRSVACWYLWRTLE